MSLYIKVENGQAVDHPVYWDNLLQAFGNVPENYHPFIRTHQPILSVFEEWDTEAQQYAFVDGVWTDLWPRKPVSSEKHDVLLQELRANIRKSIESYKVWGAQSMADALDDVKPLWEKYIEELNNVVIPETADVLQFRYPNPPLRIRRDADGKIVSINAQGSTPDVIG